jgi:hypothetical protein
MLDEVARFDVGLEFVNKFLSVGLRKRTLSHAARAHLCGRVLFSSVPDDPEYVVPAGQ